MNYIKKVEEIIKGELSSEEKIRVLFDMLVPKTMYISLPQITGINLKLLSLKRKLQENTDAYILYHILTAFFEYKLLNYREAVHIVKELQRNYPQGEKIPFPFICYTLLGVSYRSLGDNDQSLEFFQLALDCNSETPDTLKSEKFLKLLALYHISELYGEMKEYEEMLKKQLQLLKFSLEEENVDIENRSLNGIGRAYFGLKNYPEALEYLLLADQKSKVAGNIPFITRNLHDLGRVYAQMEDYNNSLKYFERSYDLRKKHKALDASITSLISIGQVYIKQLKYEKALDQLLGALELAESLGVKHKISIIYFELSNACEKNDQFELALFYYKKYDETKVELDNVTQLKVENQKLRESNSSLKQMAN
jgi:tetratricopeptide (TPR) repeat protein